MHWPWRFVVTGETDHKPSVANFRWLAASLRSILRTTDTEAYYRSPDSVDGYAKWRTLLAPERAIIDRLGGWMTSWKMLDIGVGGGRTTSHFAPLVTDYVGVDYSSPMIDACKVLFDDVMDNVKFIVADARDLSRFETGSFDFVQFSFNGLDSIGHQDRLMALSEMHRVCAPSGFVGFSSKNLSSAPELFRLCPDQRTNSAHRVGGVLYQGMFRFLNPRWKVLRQERYALVREGHDAFRNGRQYYVRPSEQLAQLNNAGFSAVEIYGLDGRRIEVSDADGELDLWLYYLAAGTIQSPHGAA
jgi:ubiquinone/menaquinone biosynthesis C-methylase UbiE